MRFDLERSLEVLTATPEVLQSLLGGLSEDWTTTSNDPEQWEAFDIVGHLIHGERTDWVARAKIILAQGGNPAFEPFDRTAQFEFGSSSTLKELLAEFALLREENLVTIRSWEMVEEELDLTGIHPELGRVSMRQLLATWVVHDLNHIRQIAECMARKYQEEVGPWRAYLSILK